MHDAKETFFKCIDEVPSNREAIIHTGPTSLILWGFLRNLMQLMRFFPKFYAMREVKCHLHLVLKLFRSICSG